MPSQQAPFLKAQRIRICPEPESCRGNSTRAIGAIGQSMSVHAQRRRGRPLRSEARAADQIIQQGAGGGREGQRMDFKFCELLAVANEKSPPRAPRLPVNHSESSPVTGAR